MHDDPTDGLVSFTKRHAFAHQVVRKLRGVEIAVRGCFESSLVVDTNVAQHGCGHCKRAVQGIDRIKDCFLVFLHILVVSERKSFHHCEQRRQITEDAPGLPAHQFHRIGVLLLGHQTRSGRHRIAQFKETKFSGRIENNVLAQP